MKDIYKSEAATRLCSNPGCGNILTGTVRQKYCSVKCKNHHANQQQATLCNCVVCKKQFRKIKKAITCSPECSAKYKSQKQAELSEEVGRLYLDLCYKFQKCETPAEQKHYIEALLEVGLNDTMIRQALLATRIHKKLKIKNLSHEGLPQQNQDVTRKEVGNMLICVLTLFKDKTFDVSFVSWSEYNESLKTEYESIDSQTVVGLFYEHDSDIMNKLEELATVKDKRLEVLIEMGILTMDLKQAERILKKAKKNINLVFLVQNHVYELTGRPDINKYFQDRRGK